jgi:hypothetical protein
MSESFVFVIGNFLDFPIERRVEMAEITRACAKKEAMYLEISNYNGANVPLFRKLLSQYVAEILHKHDKLKSDGRDIGDGKFLEFKETSNSIEITENQITTISSPLVAPFLEEDVMMDSVGSILASCIGTEHWPGYYAEEENLKHIGAHINDLIDRLATDGKSVPKQPLEYSVEEIDRNPTEIDLEELQEAFQIMGFKLPPSLQPQTSMASPSPQKKKKMRITLPSGQTADLILYDGYKVEHQVDSFLEQHDMAHDYIARERMISTAKVIPRLIPLFTLFTCY